MLKAENKQTDSTGVRVSRRRCLTGTAGLALSGLVPELVPQAWSAELELAGTGCLSLVYTNSPTEPFDFNYYLGSHIPLMLSRYARTIEHFELRQPVTSLGAAVPPYAAVMNLWVRDGEGFAAAGQEFGLELAEDVSNFTKGRVLAQMETVMGEAGSGLHSVETGQHCINLFYARADGAGFDSDYYLDSHMPLIMELYGPEAIRRFEVRSGPDNGSFTGVVSIYVEDQQRFDAASQEHMARLNADIPNFTRTAPVSLMTEILSAGS